MLGVRRGRPYLRDAALPTLMVNGDIRSLSCAVLALAPLLLFALEVLYLVTTGEVSAFNYD